MWRRDRGRLRHKAKGGWAWVALRFVRHPDSLRGLLTKNQRIAFFKLWKGARREVMAQTGAADEESARHAWIRRHTGYTDSINAVRPGADFGRLMLETALVADDYEAVAK